MTLCVIDRLSIGRPAVARAANHKVQSACRSEKLFVSISSSMYLRYALCAFINIGLCLSVD